MEAEQAANRESQKLNIFSPRKRSGLKEVLIFIHGGNWNSGNKELYSFFGNRLARKDVVAVIIDYPLSPSADYNEMAKASGYAVKWVKEHIEQYGGNPEKIFISGHSAGGHLAALVSIKNQYFDSIGVKTPIQGTILIDAAGLDMYGYLSEESFDSDNTYYKTFTEDPAAWKKASPLYYLHAGMPRMLIYRGGKTYPSIIKSNEKFVAALKPFQPESKYYILKNKKHVPMIFQFLNSYNAHYKEIVEFMKK